MWRFFFAVTALSGTSFAYPGGRSSVESQNPTDMIRGNGYHAEEYSMKTSDGYQLTMHRIPYDKKNPCLNHYTPSPECQRPVVFLQHGLFGSSMDFILAGPEQGLAYVLADAGYDVWMGNFRGNPFGRTHETLSPTEDEFWNFSWHQMGTVDLPEMIDYVLEETRQQKVHFIGHSQGTTAFLVMTSTKPRYNEKVQAAHLMAPMAFVSHMRSPLMNRIAQVTSESRLNGLIGTGEFKPSTELIRPADQANCENEDEGIPQDVCKNTYFVFSGFTREVMNMSLVPEVVKWYPAGASRQQIVHYIQNMRSGRFSQYDHGVQRNLAKYSTSNAPVYRLVDVRVPVSLYYGRNDQLVAVEDVNKLKEKLGGNVKDDYVVANAKWGHIDFVWGSDVRRAVYSRVIENMRQA